MKTIRTTLKLTVAAAWLLFSGASMAQSTWSGTWDWAAPCNPSTCDVVGATGTVRATVSAYGAETATGGFANAAIYTGSNSYLGITSAGENSTSPNHSIDNFKKDSNTFGAGTTAGGADVAEALLINFNQAVALTQIAVSWTWNDSDALIFRWDGAGAPNLLTTTPGSLPAAAGSLTSKVGSGWTLVRSGQFGATNTAGAGGAGSLGFSNSVFSSYWLVSTAISASGNDDGFKVSSFTGNVCSGQINSSGQCTSGSNSGGNSGTVSEPGTLALAAAAFVGLTQVRRRKQLKA